ncbi:MAG: DUF2304 domain-containing protein [Egibacteraceae bacterium]
MDPRIQVIAVIAAAGLLLVVLELVRRRALLERYALLWLFSAVALLVLGFWRGMLENVAALLGIAEPPNALFFLAFAAILVLLLHFSVAVSRLADRSKMLAQRLALLEERLGRAEEGASEPAEQGLEPEREIERLPR